MNNDSTLPFLKMHGLGNDFVIIDGRANNFQPNEKFLRAMSNRRRGIGLSSVGPKLETNPIFPQRSNIEIAQIVSPDRILMRVWERGAGITEACGSGACAVVVAGVRRGLCGRRTTVVLEGGELIIEWGSDNHVIMTGSASFSFSGLLPMDFGDEASCAKQ